MTLLPTHEIRTAAGELDPSWKVIDNHHLERDYAFADFASALAFTNRVGALAEEQNHHPDVHLRWGKVRLSIWSHDAGGLTTRDFRLASSIDALLPA